MHEDKVVEENKIHFRNNYIYGCSAATHNKQLEEGEIMNSDMKLTFENGEEGLNTECMKFGIA